MMRSCPVCNSNESAVLHEVDFNLPSSFSLNSLQKIRNCTQCGMVFSDSNNLQSDYDQYYSQLAKYFTPDSHITKTSQQRALITLGQIKRFINNQSLICDIGCGSGVFLKTLKSQGYVNLSGTDCFVSPSQNDFRYIQTSVFDINESEPLDLVTCIGVLEHLFDLTKAINHISRMISNDGYIYIEVPCATLYSEKIISPFQDFNLEHINHFSQKSLSNLLMNQFLEMSNEIIYQPESELYNMPVISFLGRKKTLIKKNIEKDLNLKTSIESYINGSNLLLGKFNSYLEKKINDTNEIYIWGAGQLSLKLIDLPVFKRVKVKAFIDKNPSFQKIKNIPVISHSMNLDSNFPILIGSTINCKSIQESILNKKIKNKIIQLLNVEK